MENEEIMMNETTEAMTDVEVFNKFCNWVGNLKGKKTVEAEAEEVQEDESEE